MNTVQTVGNSQHRRGPAKGRSSLDLLEVITGDKQKLNNFQTIKIVIATISSSFILSMIIAIVRHMENIYIFQRSMVGI